MSNSKGELHRIYWQQWVSSSERKSRRELITSSAGIRISHSGAKAKDVTQLLRDTLKIRSTQMSQPESGDHLVLVGTLYSLPRDYIQFEHEQERRLSHSLETQQNSNSTAIAATPPSVSPYPKSDPYHVVKTLHPEDDPLEIKRRMEARLKQLQREAPVSRTIISPKLQWFFIPSSNDKESLIPNCVELDGYCSSLEDEEGDCRSTHSNSDSFDDDEEERISNGAQDRASTDNEVHDTNLSNDQSLSSSSISNMDDIVTKRFSWLDKNVSEQTSRNEAQINIDPAIAHKVNKQQKRRQIFHKQYNSTVKAQAYAGYLFKQSHQDSNVWRKCFSVITDDYLWYISRMYGIDNGHDKLSYSKHGRIRLTHALLLEPSPDYAPLFRTPFAFELVTGNGTSHVFRASGKARQTNWIQTLSSRIIQAYENSFLDNAELIVADETVARTQRMETLATDPLWKAIVSANDRISVDEHVTRMRGHLGAVLRWGMQVSVFKERCRQIQRSLPAKSPIVVTTLFSESSSRPTSFASHPIGSVDPFVSALMETAWTRAAELLARATHVATQLQSRLPHSIEAQCRHIDYMIHGRFRTNSAEDASRSSLGDHQRSPGTDKDEKSVSERNNSHRDAPPIDLFDQLLTDLQLLAANKVAVTKRVKNDGDQPSSSGDNGLKGIE
ncbi:hypothetical protein FisN_35Lh040 [Fistulifera solaris]|uniref:PH domain-containing protein n=1 Tax=Fistulifera solaris TaxID=1519565 RepID=A0A1Z5KPD5_FISSO|nr:hypothetical protein FisN_35Lh040 [Fistulifera solaris]|eukprot:GAX28184.1 hypothetical protein FisN_35Lh040 [Fistulifera solaris]